MMVRRIIEGYRDWLLRVKRKARQTYFDATLALVMFAKFLGDTSSAIITHVDSEAGDVD